MQSACTEQQQPQRGGAVPDPIWFESKCLLAFPRISVTPGTPHAQTIFFWHAVP